MARAIDYREENDGSDRYSKLQALYIQIAFRKKNVAKLNLELKLAKRTKQANKAAILFAEWRSKCL